MEDTLQDGNKDYIDVHMNPAFFRKILHNCGGAAKDDQVGLSISYRNIRSGEEFRWEGKWYDTEDNPRQFRSSFWLQIPPNCCNIQMVDSQHIASFGRENHWPISGCIANGKNSNSSSNTRSGNSIWLFTTKFRVYLMGSYRIFPLNRLDANQANRIPRLEAIL